MPLPKLTTKYFTHKYLPARALAEQGWGAGLSSQPIEEKVMLVFHGLGDSLNGFTWMPPQLALNSLSYLLVNAPDDYYGGYSWFNFSGGGAFMENALPGIRRSRDIIHKLIDEVIGQGVKAENILLFGFSQGCLMALDAGLRYPKKLAGICGVSGWVASMEEYPQAFSNVAKEQKFFVTHGFQDPVLPYTNTKTQCEALQAMDVNLTFKSYQKDHTILPEELDEIRRWIKGRID